MLFFVYPHLQWTRSASQETFVFSLVLDLGCFSKLSSLGFTSVLECWRDSPLGITRECLRSVTHSLGRDARTTVVQTRDFAFEKYWLVPLNNRLPRYCVPLSWYFNEMPITSCERTTSKKWFLERWTEVEGTPLLNAHPHCRYPLWPWAQPNVMDHDAVGEKGVRLNLGKRTRVGHESVH